MDASGAREITENVISGRGSGVDMARLYSISQPTVSRIVAQAPYQLGLACSLNKASTDRYAAITQYRRRD